MGTDFANFSFLAQITLGLNQALTKRDESGLTVLELSARTDVAAVASLVAARLFRLSETYWAPITTLVITQSSLGAAFSVSWKRFVGTALGALVGGGCWRATKRVLW